MKFKIGDIVTFGERKAKIVEFDSFDMLYKLELDSYIAGTVYVFVSEKFLNENIATCVCGAKYDREFPDNHMKFCDVYKQQNMDATISNIERSTK